MSFEPKLLCGKKEMGLSLAEDHEEEDSATSDPERLCVGVIINDVGPMAV